MKKIGTLLILVFLLSVQKTNAQVFNLEKNENYMYKLSWKNENTINTMIITMYKIYDNNADVFYNVEPKITMFERRVYNKTEIALDFDTYKKINKIIYFGYGYENNITDEYYFATQYLIFKELGIAEVEIVDKNHNKSDYAAKEIDEIEKRIQDYKFMADDYTTNSSKIVINDEYIIKHFEFKGEYINVNLKNNIYEIELLDEKNNYKIDLKSKNNCLPAVYWASKIAPDLVGKTELCEDDNVIYITREINDTEDNKDSNLNQNESESAVIPEDYIIKEKIEVSVPSTSQYNLNWLLLLLAAGNIYYVCKK